MGYLRSRIWASEAISGPVYGGRFWGHSGSILSYSGTLSGPYLRNLMKCPEKPFIWPWVGPYGLNMAKYGYLGGSG